jgi:hypothetical protein
MASPLAMKPEDRYHRFVRWSAEDQCYIGYCPDLYYGGICHGDGEEATYADLCTIVRDEVAHRMAKGNTLPAPAVRPIRDLDLEAATGFR